jgi:hypothetical protein
MYPDVRHPPVDMTLQDQHGTIGEVYKSLARWQELQQSLLFL